jgi:hypothetical protein
MAGMSHSMPGMRMDATTAPAGHSTAAFPTLLVAGLTAAVCVLLVVRLLHSVRRSRPVGERLDAFCEAAMAGAMGYLLLLMS